MYQGSIAPWIMLGTVLCGRECGIPVDPDSEAEGRGMVTSYYRVMLRKRWYDFFFIRYGMDDDTHSTWYNKHLNKLGVLVMAN